MAAEERWGNLYLYGCTVGALRFIAQTSQPLIAIGEEALSRSAAKPS